ncbi:MAG: nucleotide pyrophosphohydrolase [Bacteriovorax sp.]
MDLEKIIGAINEFSSKRDWDQFYSIKNLVSALCDESSQLFEIYQWISEEESNDKKNEVLLNKTTEELADIFIYLLLISSRININLEETVLKKMQQIELKYPVEKSKGSALKYSDL